MKKLKNYLFITLLSVLLVLPLTVKAATVTIGWESEKPTKNCVNENGTCTMTNNLTITLGSDVPSFAGTSVALTIPEGVTNVSLVGQNGYTVTKSGDSYVIALDEGATSAEAGKTTVIAKFTADISKDVTDCSVDVTANGKKSTMTITEENTKTGVSLPYAILGVSAIAAIGIYTVTNKKSKLHKI